MSVVKMIFGLGATALGLVIVVAGFAAGLGGATKFVVLVGVFFLITGIGWVVSGRKGQRLEALKNNVNLEAVGAQLLEMHLQGKGYTELIEHCVLQGVPRDMADKFVTVIVQNAPKTGGK